jgi:hypothetical protein
LTVGVWGSNPHAPTNFLSKDQSFYYLLINGQSMKRLLVLGLFVVAASSLAWLMS